VGEERSRGSDTHQGGRRLGLVNDVGIDLSYGR
jgi:hypothetical protein